MAIEPQKVTFRGILRELGLWLVTIVAVVAVFIGYQLYFNPYVSVADWGNFPALGDGWSDIQHGPDHDYRLTSATTTFRFPNMGYPLGAGSYTLNFYILDNPKGSDAPQPGVATVSLGGQTLGVITDTAPLDVPFALMRANGPDPTFIISTNPATQAGGNSGVGLKIISFYLYVKEGSPNPIIPAPMPLIFMPLTAFFYYSAIRKRPPNWPSILFAILVPLLPAFSYAAAPSSPWIILTFFLLAICAFLILWRRDIATWWSNRQQRPSTI